MLEISFSCRLLALLPSGIVAAACETGLLAAIVYYPAHGQRDISILNLHYAHTSLFFSSVLPPLPAAHQADAFLDILLHLHRRRANLVGLSNSPERMSGGYNKSGVSPKSLLGVFCTNPTCIFVQLLVLRSFRCSAELETEKGAERLAKSASALLTYRPSRSSSHTPVLFANDGSISHRVRPYVHCTRLTSPPGSFGE